MRSICMACNFDSACPTVVAKTKSCPSLVSERPTRSSNSSLSSTTRTRMARDRARSVDLGQRQPHASKALVRVVGQVLAPRALVFDRAIVADDHDRVAFFG